MTTTTSRPGGTTYRDVLANGEFRAVLGAWVISMLGNVVSHVALAVLVLDRTGSPLLSALTFALGFMPYAVGGALFSAVADRYPARRVLVAGDLLQGGLVAVMVVPGVPVWALLALVAATGVVAPVYAGARSASLPDMMPTEAFPLARALLRMVAMGSQIIGFGVGGVLLVFLEPRVLLMLDAGSFVLSALLLRIGTRARPARGPGIPHAAGRRSVTADSWAGLRVALASRTIRPLLLLTWLPPMFAVAPEGLAAPYVEQIGAPDYGLGLLLGAAAVGSVAGAVAFGSWVSPPTRERLIVPMALVQLLPLLAFLLRPSLLLAATLLVLVGLGTTYELGLDQRLLAALDDTGRGVVLSVSSSGLMLTQGLGFALAGAGAELLPITVVVAGSGGLGLVVVAVLTRSLRTRAGAAHRAPSGPVWRRSR